MSQGMATVQGFTPTVDGNDEKLTLHYWGRMALASELLPHLRKAGESGASGGGGRGARVISVLSGGVHGAYGGYTSDPELKRGYSIKNAADAAGFYNDLGLDSLALAPGNEKVKRNSVPGRLRAAGTQAAETACMEHVLH